MSDFTGYTCLTCVKYFSRFNNLSILAIKLTFFVKNEAVLHTNVRLSVLNVLNFETMTTHGLNASKRSYDWSIQGTAVT